MKIKTNKIMKNIYIVKKILIISKIIVVKILTFSLNRFEDYNKSFKNGYNY